MPSKYGENNFSNKTLELLGAKKKKESFPIHNRVFGVYSPTDECNFLHFPSRGITIFHGVKSTMKILPFRPLFAIHIGLLENSNSEWNNEAEILNISWVFCEVPWNCYLSLQKWMLSHYYLFYGEGKCCAISSNATPFLSFSLWQCRERGNYKMYLHYYASVFINNTRKL